MPYSPEVNDYVVWTTALGMKHEGWVYFKSTPVTPKRGWKTPLNYITIELAVKEKPDYTEDNPHRYVHVLLCCYEHQWEELSYVKRRKGKNGKEEVIDLYPDYKSQEHRYEDVQ